MEANRSESIQQAAQFLKTYDNYVLVAHISPDGDTLGSCLALSLGLTQMNKRNTVVCEDSIPSLYRFLPESDRVLTASDISDFDVAISVDCADINRLGNAKVLFEQAKHTLCIDHHRTNDGFGEKNCVLVSASTGEIIVRILESLNIKLDKDISTCLYTAITTDTGNLAYKGTTPDTFRIMADVVESGIDISVLNQKIFRSEPYKKMRLRALAIENTVFCENNRIGISTLTLKQMNDLHCIAEDVEGLIDNIRDIDTVEVAALLRESTNGNIRVSFRGKNAADVSGLAKKYNGGGHRLAAGCTLEMNMVEALKLIKSELPSCLKD